MARQGLIVFVAENRTAQARIASLLPDGMTVCSLTWHADGSQFPQPPDLILAQNKDRCVNRALIFAQGLAAAAPIYVYSYKFTDFRRNDLQRRGATGILSLDSPTELLQASLAELLLFPPLQGEAGRRRKTQKRKGLPGASVPDPQPPAAAATTAQAPDGLPVRRAVWGRRRRNAA